VTAATRLVLVALATLTLAASAQAGSRPVGGKPVSGLRAFLYRIDDSPQQRTFSRTPAFAWDPVPTALHYEFQLSTSDTFRDSGILFQDSNVPSPAEAINVPLPWVTGSPYSLYARVRAVLPKTITPWSPSFGFNMRWICDNDTSSACYPKQLDSSAYPGLVRWSPVDGATAYEVWYNDPNTKFFTSLTSADEREYYTLHQDPAWTGAVHWRVRAIRDASYGSTANGLPTRTFGPWSPTYTSTNPALATGPLAPVATVSDNAVETGLASDPAHASMPAFVFRGNQAADGTQTELYRVEVYSDSDCLNRVYMGSMIGSPAWAPRTYDAPVSQDTPFRDPKTYPASLAYPTDSGALDQARKIYLLHGVGSPDALTSYEGEVLPPSVETLSAAAPDITPTAAAPAASGTPAAAAPAAGAAGGVQTGAKGSYVPGAPVNLWDVEWPKGGYYWTIVPVKIVAKGALNTKLSAFSPVGSTTIFVTNGTNASVGSTVQIGSGGTMETTTISAISGTSITLAGALANLHSPGESVTSPGASVTYQDAELPSEACTSAHRVQSFGKTSAAPTVSSPSKPYVSGLSSNGRLIAANQKLPTFYGVPLVSWAAVPGAGAYEVQWSKKAYPFKLEPGNDSIVTFATSSLLGPQSNGSTRPLAAGKWYYRVRGIDFSLTAGTSPASRRLSWSEPQPIVVAAPRFKIVKP
jgi:hypothetical protein